MPRGGEHRKAKSVRMSAEEHEAINKRVAAVQKVAEQRGLTAPTDSDVIRWLIAEGRRKTTRNWMPDDHGLKPRAKPRKPRPPKPSPAPEVEQVADSA